MHLFFILCNIVYNSFYIAFELIASIIAIYYSLPFAVLSNFQIFWIIISLVIGAFFTQNSNNYYIQNYTINNNISIQKDEQLDFIDNARYVIAEKLNVRSGPGKIMKLLIL